MVGWIRIPVIKNDPQKISIFLSVGCSLSRAGGVSCGFDVLHGGLGISTEYWNFDQNNMDFLAVKFYNFWSSNS
jgi:hypothetical protein